MMVQVQSTGTINTVQYVQYLPSTSRTGFEVRGKKQKAKVSSGVTSG